MITHMDDIEIETIVVGPLMTNCYIISEGGDCIVIDAGAEGERIVEAIRNRGLSLTYILASHGHFDHVAGIEPLREAFGAPFHIHSSDLGMFRGAHDMAKKFAGTDIEDLMDPEGFIGENGYTLGKTELVPVHTPGHTGGSTSFLIGKHLFSGDTLFRGSIGRMDFGGSVEAMKNTIEQLKKMDDDILVHPGHGPGTTIGDEKRENPFLTYYKL